MQWQSRNECGYFTFSSQLGLCGVCSEAARSNVNKTLTQKENQYQRSTAKNIYNESGYCVHSFSFNHSLLKPSIDMSTAAFNTYVRLTDRLVTTTWPLKCKLQHVPVIFTAIMTSQEMPISLTKQPSGTQRLLGFGGPGTMHLGSFQPVCDEGQTLRLNIWKQQYRGVEGVKQRAIKKKKKAEKNRPTTQDSTPVSSHILYPCVSRHQQHMGGCKTDVRSQQEVVQYLNCYALSGCASVPSRHLDPVNTGPPHPKTWRLQG